MTKYIFLLFIQVNTYFMAKKFANIIGFHRAFTFDNTQNAYDINQILTEVSNDVDKNTICFIKADSTDEERKIKDIILHENNTYTITQNEIYGVGNALDVNDFVYTPGNTSLKTIQIGGIPKDTNAETLNGQTFSELFDMILFPTYAPKFTDATASITLSNTSLVKIGGTLPTATINVSKAFTTAGSQNQNVVYGGDSNIANGSEVTTTATSITVGTKTWSQSVTFAKGTDFVKDSKGQYITVNKTGSNYTTLLESGSTNNNLEKSGNNYVIKSITKTANASVEVVYPYYLPNASGVSTEQALTSNNYFTDISYNATNAKSFMYIELPESASNVKILMKNLAGVYEEQPLNETVETVTKTINGTEYTYKKYSMYLSGGFNGSGVYKITFTKPK